MKIKDMPFVTTSANETARSYVQLALAVGQHFPWYVDAYYGPPEWANQAKAQGLRSAAELAREAADLIIALARDRDAEMDSQRGDFLARQALAMQTTLRILQGERLPIVEEANALFDISPEWVDEAVFEEAHRTLDDLLPAGDSLPERMTLRRKATEVGFECVESLLHDISAEIRCRTKTRFPLPPRRIAGVATRRRAAIQRQ